MAVCVVGISGGSCSGKTTLAALLTRHYGQDCVVLSQDWYYRDLSALAPAERVRFNFDTPEAVDAALLAAQAAALAEGRCVDAPQYDFALHTRRPEVRRLDPAPVIVVEGLHVIGLPELEGLLNLRVFVDAPEPLRLARRLARDTAERGRTEAQVLAQFEETVRPMHARFVAPLPVLADLRADGAAPMAPTAAALAGRIDRLLRSGG